MVLRGGMATPAVLQSSSHSAPGVLGDSNWELHPLVSFYTHYGYMLHQVSGLCHPSIQGTVRGLRRCGQRQEKNPSAFWDI